MRWYYKSLEIYKIIKNFSLKNRNFVVSKITNNKKIEDYIEDYIEKYENEYIFRKEGKKKYKRYFQIERYKSVKEAVTT